VAAAINSGVTGSHVKRYWPHPNRIDLDKRCWARLYCLAQIRDGRGKLIRPNSQQAHARTRGEFSHRIAAELVQVALGEIGRIEISHPFPGLPRVACGVMAQYWRAEKPFTRGRSAKGVPSSRIVNGTSFAIGLLRSLRRCCRASSCAPIRRFSCANTDCYLKHVHNVVTLIRCGQMNLPSWFAVGFGPAFEDSPSFTITESTDANGGNCHLQRAVVDSHR